MRASGAPTGFAAAGRLLPAVLALLVAAAPLALAQPGGGEATPAAGHDEAASYRNGSPKHAVPVDDRPRGRGSDDATRPRSGHSVKTGEYLPHGAGRHIRPGEGAKKGAADSPAIEAKPIPAPAVTTRPIKDPVHKPFRAPQPAVQVRRPPSFAIGTPVRNAIGLRFDRPPIAKPSAATAPTAGVTTAAKIPGAAGPIGGMAALHQGIAPDPIVPRNPGLNGTAIGRVGAGPATVGGAARSTTGINGTSFRPKHGN